MEYQEQFNEFFENFLEENVSLSPTKIKFTNYKWLFYLMKSAKNEREAIYINLKTAQKNIIKIKGKEYLVTTREIVPQGYYRIIDCYQVEYQAMNSFYALICSLKTLILSYKQNEKIHLTVLQTLLYMYSYFFNEEVDSFESCMDTCFDLLNSKKIPPIFSSKISEYIQFFTQMVCQYDAFDYKRYQKELLKKNTK